MQGTAFAFNQRRACGQSSLRQEAVQSCVAKRLLAFLSSPCPAPLAVCPECLPVLMSTDYSLCKQRMDGTFVAMLHNFPKGTGTQALRVGPTACPAFPATAQTDSPSRSSRVINSLHMPSSSCFSRSLDCRHIQQRRAVSGGDGQGRHS